ncbi:MAG: MATE family efflux transporter, partial [bacterium]
PERDHLRELTGLASPAFWEALVFRGAQVVFMRFVSALGEVALAAHQVALSIESLSYMPGWGFAVASTTLGGQFVGAKRPELAERSVTRTLKIGLSILSSFGLIFLAFGDKIALLFGGTPQVLAQAGIAIRLGGLEQPGLAIFMIISGALRGAGDTRSPMIATLFGVFLGRLLLVYLLAFPLGLGLAGVWIATAFDWSLRAGISYYFFKKGAWRGYL